MKRIKTAYCLLFAAILIVCTPKLFYAQETRSTKVEDLDFLRNNKTWIELDVEVNSWWVYEDDQDFFWFNSSEGLCKFDGNQFYHFKYNPDNPKSIPNGFITAFEFENEALVWLGYRKLGLFLYDIHSEQIVSQFLHNPENPTTITSDYISGILKDENGELWILTNNSILQRYNSSDSTFTKYTLPFHSRFRDYNKDSSPGKIIQDVNNPDILWIGSKFGIYYFNTSSGESILYEIDKYVEPYGYQFSTPLHQTEDGLLWYGHFRNEGVKVFDPQKKEWIAKMPVSEVSSSFIFDIKPYGDSLLIASIRRKHFMIMDKFNPGVFEIHEGNDAAGFSIIPVDKNKNIYSTSPTGKLTKLNRYWSLFNRIDLRETLNLEFVPWCIVFDQKNELLYLSARHGGNVLVLNGSYEYVKEFSLSTSDEKPSTLIRSMTLDSLSNHIYFATNKGAFSYDQDSEQISKLFRTSNFENEYVEEVILNGEELWLKCKKHLLRRRNQNGAFEKIEIPFVNSETDEINSVLITDMDQMFISSTKGLFLYDLQKGKFKNYSTSKQNLESIDCNALINKNGEIWMGTAYNGIYKLTRKDSLSFDIDVFYNSLSSLTNWNQSISSFENQIWSSTSSGFTVFDINREDFISFQKSDGILRSYRRMRFFNGPEGSFLGPFHYGFYNFKPKNIVPDTVTPYLLKIKVNNKAIDYKDWTGNKDVLTFDHTKKDITFILGARNYGVDNTNFYRYRLRRDNQDWVFLENNNIVNLTNLPSGDYTLEFDARSFHSYWNNNPFKLQFKIKKHPLLSWWIKLMYCCIGLFLLFIIYRFLENDRSKKQKLLTLQKERAESELKALKAQMNPHFLFNTLNSINWFIIKKKPIEASKYLTKFSKLMRLILDNSKEDRISLARELETLSLYTELEQVRFEDEFEYEFNIDENIDQKKYLIPPLIFQPFIENAIWHGLIHKKGIGHITLKISSEKEQLKCVIEDNGIGRIAAQEIKDKTINYRQSSGIEITKNRIIGINAKGIESFKIIDLLDNNGRALGTRVEIIIPKETRMKKQ